MLRAPRPVPLQDRPRGAVSRGEAAVPPGALVASVFDQGWGGPC